MQIGLGQQICESANLRFLEVSQIRRFADWLGLQICESAFSREKRRFQICESAFSREKRRFLICESAFSREKRRFADLQIGWGLQICESAFSREKRRFADLQIGWGLQICKSAFSRGNADSQICRLTGWGYKSANLRFLKENADFKSANLHFLEETQVRRFADWFGATNLRICESAFS